MRTLGYLSGAPRVSTRPEAEATGPRSHVLGVITAFENKGFAVKRFIAGDLAPESWIGEKSAKKISNNIITRLAADIIRLWFRLTNYRKVYRLVGEVEFVYERFSAFQALGRIFQKNGIPWILETNALLFKEAGIERKSMVLTGLAKKMELNAYEQCDFLVCISTELKNSILENVTLPEKKIIVLPNAVDINRFAPRETFPPSPDNIPTLGFVGLLAKYQGLETLIKAIAEIRTEGFIYRLLIVGDGPERSHLERLADQLKLNEFVSFTGRIPWEQIPAKIADFDICYSGQEPIHSIGRMYLSPLKLYEYGAMAKSIIASANEDSMQLLTEETGYLFEASNIDSLKRTLIKALNQRDSWIIMGKKLRENIERNHSWNARIDHLISVTQKNSSELFGYDN